MIECGKNLCNMKDGLRPEEYIDEFVSGKQKHMHIGYAGRGIVNRH